MGLSRVRNDDGWTLLELMAVVLILGILVGIAIASYSISTERSRRVTCQMNQRTLNTAVLSYGENHPGLPPDLESVRGLTAGQDDQFGRCPADRDTEYEYDPLTGRVTCPLHPQQ